MEDLLDDQGLAKLDLVKNQLRRPKLKVAETIILLVAMIVSLLIIRNVYDLLVENIVGELVVILLIVFCLTNLPVIYVLLWRSISIKVEQGVLPITALASTPVTFFRGLSWVFVLPLVFLTTIGIIAVVAISIYSQFSWLYLGISPLIAMAVILTYYLLETSDSMKIITQKNEKP